MISCKVNKSYFLVCFQTQMLGVVFAQGEQGPPGRNCDCAEVQTLRDKVEALTRNPS